MELRGETGKPTYSVLAPRVRERLGMASVSATLKRAPICILFAVVLFGAFTFGGSAARADLTETIDTPNAALSGFTGPYATVDIMATDPNHATITFTSLTTSGITFLMGDGGTADLNVNGAYTLGTVTETNSLPGFTPTFSANSPGNVDGFGTFNLSLNNSDGYTSSADSVKINISNTTGLWTSDAAVLVANAGGFDAAIHAFACNAPCTTGQTSVPTGFAAHKAPEPTSLVLLATALAGIGIFAQRRRPRSRL